MMEKVKWGIIGTGVIAPSHASAIAASDYAELVAVCDIDEPKAREFSAKYGSVPVYTDYIQMLEEAGLEAVSICTPSGLHSEMTIEAADRGVNVLCEKPMAITLEQMDAMVEAVNRTGIKAEVVFQRRTSPLSQKVREAVQRGDLGQMVLGDAYLKYYRSPAYYKSADWRATWALDGGGALMNQGVHGVDLLLWIMGSPVKTVFGKAEAKVRDIEVEDTAVAVLTFENGAYGVIEGTTSCNPGETTTFALHGDRGTIIFGDKGLEKWAVAPSREEVAQPVEVQIEEQPALLSSADPRAVAVQGHRFHVDDLARAIRENKKPFVTVEEARAAVELILAIYQSARTGREVVMKDFVGR
ncbi:MAG: Gfo/Idh/MocA family oxidoreductase [Anaerolineae bacterium]|nr:Gfo/Idh/MocA family oxidoreductase [Anaerolineae bacterium]